MKLIGPDPNTNATATGNKRMAIEIERKFLVDTDLCPAEDGTKYVQGYLGEGPDAISRVRVAGDKAYLTIKGRNAGMSRPEFEYEIPVSEAEDMLKLCRQPLIEKTRYHITVGDHLWEVDEFHGANEGLWLAEIELSAEDESFEMPDWVAKEVTDDARYYNANLAQYPFPGWGNDNIIPHIIKPD